MASKDNEDRSASTALDSESKALLEGVRGHFAEASSVRRRQAEIEARLLPQIAKEREAFGARIYEAGLRAIGVSGEELEAQRARENRLLDELAANLLEDARSHARRIHEQQKKRVAQLMRIRPLYATAANQSLACITTATSVEFGNGGGALIGGLSVDAEDEEPTAAVGANMVRFRDTAKPRDKWYGDEDWRRVTREAYFHFQWRPDRAGLMKANALLQGVGTFEVKAPYEAWVTTKGRVKARARLAVSTSLSGPITVESPVQSVLHESVVESDGGVIVGIPSPFSTGDVMLATDPVAVDANRTLYFTVVLETEVGARGTGYARLDAMSDSWYGFNVPFVSVSLLG